MSATGGFRWTERLLPTPVLPTRLQERRSPDVRGGSRGRRDGRAGPPRRVVARGLPRRASRLPPHAEPVAARRVDLVHGPGTRRAAHGGGGGCWFGAVGPWPGVF